MPKQPLALIHASLGRAANWRGFISALGSDVSPLQIELPSHGLADVWDRTRDFSDQALELALDVMPSDAVPLIGHSFGAALALRLAVERPYRVSSLVLVEPVFFAAAKERWGFEKAMRDMEPFAKKMSNAQFATAAKEFYSIWGGADWDGLSSDTKSYMVNLIETVPAANPLLIDDVPGLLRPGRLEELDMPVTFVDGGQTHPVIPDIISELGDRIADAEWVSIKDAGHMLPITHPEMLAKAVEGRLFV